MRARNAGKGIVLTDRDRMLIAEVADFGLMTRDQIRRRCRFGSLTRINATLLRLVRAGYLSRRFQPTLTGWRRALYYLGPSGVHLVDGEATQSPDRRRLRQWSDLFTEHQLLVNEVRLAFTECVQPGYCFGRWLTETALRERTLPILPDGYVEYEIENRTFTAFLELDRGTEPRRRWTQKTTAYLDFAFSGHYETGFSRRFFRVLVVTLSAGRLEQLRREIVRHTDRIFWLTTLPELTRHGPLGSIWRRPSGTELHSLAEP